MAQASGKEVRGADKALGGIRPTALGALLLPLLLGACVSDNGRLTGAAAIAPTIAPVEAASAAPVITKPVDAAGAPIDMAVVLPSSREAALAALAAPSGVARPAAAPAEATVASLPGVPTAVALPTPPPVGSRSPAKAVASAPVTVPEQPSLVAATGRTVVAATGKSVATAGRAVKSTAALATGTVTDAVTTVGQTAAAVTVAGVAKAGEVADLIRATARTDDLSRGNTISGSAKLDRMIETAAMENGVPKELAYAVVRVESRFNPRAIGGGAYGLSQIKPATARGLGFSGSAQALLDPETNLRWGMKYLAGAWEKGDGDVCRTAMKYKGGHRTTTMSRSASAYCTAVKQHMAAIKRRRAPIAASDTLVATVTSRPVAGLPGVKAPATIAVADRSRAAAVAALAPVAGSRTGQDVAAVVPQKSVLKPARTLAASFAPRRSDFDTSPRAASGTHPDGGRVGRASNGETALGFN